MEWQQRALSRARVLLPGDRGSGLDRTIRESRIDYGWPGASISMPYSGAFAAARSSRLRRSASLSSGAGEVRVATGSPNSAKKRSRPAGATVHSSLASSPAVLRKAWGALAGR